MSLAVFLAGLPAGAVCTGPGRTGATTGQNKVAYRSKQALLRSQVPHPRGFHQGSVPATLTAESAAQAAQSHHRIIGAALGTPIPEAVTVADIGYAPSASITADFNGDGKQDWATAMYGDDTVWVFLSNGDGTWKAPEIFPLKGSGPIAITTADLRKSGRVDLIVAESDSSTVGILLANGDGTFQAESTFTLPGPPLSVTAGDFNGDGHADVLIGNSGAIGRGPLTFLAGNGAGGLGGAVSSAQANDFAGAQSLAVGDFNKDGKLDVLVTDDIDAVFIVSRVYLESGQGDGTFQADRTVATQSPFVFTGSPVADLNGDGCLDAVTITTQSMAQVYLGNCDGSFTIASHAATALGDTTFSSSLVDMNGDGVLDLVTGGSQYYAVDGESGPNAGNDVSVAFGDGKGGFAPQATVYRTGGANLFGLVVANLHGGGLPDVIAPSASASTLSVLSNDGAGQFAAPNGSAYAYFGGGTTNIPTSPPLVADFNGDGRPDVAILRIPQYGGLPYTLAVTLQKADGTFAEPRHFKHVHRQQWIDHRILQQPSCRRLPKPGYVGRSRD